MVLSRSKRGFTVAPAGRLGGSGKEVAPSMISRGGATAGTGGRDALSAGPFVMRQAEESIVGRRGRRDASVRDERAGLES